MQDAAISLHAAAKHSVFAHRLADRSPNGPAGRQASDASGGASSPLERRGHTLGHISGHIPGGAPGTTGEAAQALSARPVETAHPGEAASANRGSDLTEAEQAQVEALRARDAEVRRHEQAHASVGGPYAGAPTYDYQTGPDGKRYAIGGSVSIDVSPIPDDPEATIQKMEIVKRAALAPAEPSGPDRRVAALADRQRLAAMADLAERRAEELHGEDDPRGADEPSGASQAGPLSASEEARAGYATARSLSEDRSSAFRAAA